MWVEPSASSVQNTCSAVDLSFHTKAHANNYSKQANGTSKWESAGEFLSSCPSSYIYFAFFSLNSPGGMQEFSNSIWSALVFSLICLGTALSSPSVHLLAQGASRTEWRKIWKQDKWFASLFHISGLTLSGFNSLTGHVNRKVEHEQEYKGCYWQSLALFTNPLIAE